LFIFRYKVRSIMAVLELITRFLVVLIIVVQFCPFKEHFDVYKN